MADVEKSEMISKLSESRESIKLLQNMLKKELSNVEYEIKLVDDAKRNLDEVLFGLTGDKFYQNNGGL